MMKGDLVMLSHYTKDMGFSGFWSWSDDGNSLWIDNGSTAVVLECGEEELGFDSIIQVLCCEKIINVLASHVKVIRESG